MDSFGSGVSRVLQSLDTQYLETIWQQGKPPTDADLNLIQQLANEGIQAAVLRGMPSGFLGNETNPQQDFLTHPSWSNYFKFGPQRLNELAPIMWANVNGWLIPVAGTKTGAPPGRPNNVDYSNIITLDPPPSSQGDSRADFVFLEVWKARIQPNPVSTNKPSASGIYKYGNVETGFDYIPDDLIDPAIGFETNQRVQVQYRIRVVSGLVGLTSNPDGFDPVVVKAQGSAAAPTSESFRNMRKELGDPGLWRAGDGTQSNALGTVDGYSYAIPIAVVFRRNSTAWLGAPFPNLNGAFNRNPTATTRSGIKTFSTIPTLLEGVTATATTLRIASTLNVALPTPVSAETPVLIQVGDELMKYSNIADNVLTVQRGQIATTAEAHAAGTVVRILSGRPDGLFADQVANTDVLDLRHIVSPRGFDYGALLKGNLDKLLRGQLRANWKQSGGAGSRGTFVHYQDLLGSSSSLPLGVTKVQDVPDNIRMVYSDAATVQPVEIICRPFAQSVAGPTASAIGVSPWSLALTVNTTLQLAADKFSAGDKIVIPVKQLKDGLDQSSPEQVRWMYDAQNAAIRLRLEGETHDLSTTMYTVLPSFPTSDDDLTITFASNFPGADARILHIRAHVVYGPGRGLARRPDCLHSVSYLAASSDLLTQQWGTKAASVAWALQWSKYRSSAINGLLPVTAETYADLGSKTLIVTPFRRIDFPEVTTIDGRAANNAAAAKLSTSATLLADNNRTVMSLSSAAGVSVGDALVVTSTWGQGRYYVAAVNATATPNTITVERTIMAVTNTALTISIYASQGCMPLKTSTGAAKWSQTDPLGLFCGTSQGNTSGPASLAYESIYVSLPRHLIPGWGELAVPILANPTDYFATGVNYMVRTVTGAATSIPDAQKNFAAYHNGGTSSKEYSVFSQVTYGQLAVLPYNTASADTGDKKWAGIRFFTDTRGLGRQGLEFPPFYGIARIFGVYQASDYSDNDSPFTPQRAAGGSASGAVNLLRQSMGPQDGPVMWVEIDNDGDSTFILNANAIDISRAPTRIASFAAGTYVVEAVVFGFDRGSFDLNGEFRLIPTRPGNRNAWSKRADGLTSVDQANTSAGRSNNIGKSIAGLAGLLPGPARSTDQLVVNYSRTVYQGDAWGTQTGNVDIGYSPGPVASETAYKLASQRLDQSALTRPNQKVLEVLASTSFSTALGTGRYSGDASNLATDFRNVAYEDPTVNYPPLTYPPSAAYPLDVPPKVQPVNFVTDWTVVHPEYLGCTERLPLGALFRDKDFRGQVFSNVASPLLYADSVGVGTALGSSALNSGTTLDWTAPAGSPLTLFSGASLEQQEIPLGPAASGVGSPGDILVHVDGEQAAYSQLTNFRVTRGGSVFNASGSRPGGPLSVTAPFQPTPRTNRVNILHGRAMLVRNTITNAGASEVSAGDELMLLIVTSVQRAPSNAVSIPPLITIGTSGAGEGYAAADLYRIEGHPLVRNNLHTQLDPSTITLGRS